MPIIYVHGLNNGVFLSPYITLKMSRKNEQPRMPGKGAKIRKRKKRGKHPPATRAARPSVTLASPHTPTMGEEASGRSGGAPPPEYGPGSDSEESYRPQPDSEDQHTEVDSAGSYDRYMDFHEGSAEHGEYGECSDISLRFDYSENPSMDVEEVL
ncbi:hypothetical protein P4O66_004536 [Electrophorus voltai]|uniref:Uncharacterized protein n=1 Tax=Electrophorus voltai TaxID=2609070 RepID=A0AAD8ZLY5_9TELE|nr:hypothetical protein P4O66_004536 [Electrophorus voltai]